MLREKRQSFNKGGDLIIVPFDKFKEQKEMRMRDQMERFHRAAELRRYDIHGAHKKWLEIGEKIPKRLTFKMILLVKEA